MVSPGLSQRRQPGALHSTMDASIFGKPVQRVARCGPSHRHPTHNAGGQAPRIKGVASFARGAAPSDRALRASLHDLGDQAGQRLHSGLLLLHVAVMVVCPSHALERVSEDKLSSAKACL